MKIYRIFLSSIIGFLLISSFASCNSENNCEEVISDDCLCITVYDPVCGCNNKTYSNSCDAECSGITEFTKGKCM